MQPGGRWVNAASGLGGPTDRSQSDEYTAGLPVDQWLADALLETNALARRIADQEPQDATRKGYDLVEPGRARDGRARPLDPAVADAIEAACEGGDDGQGLGLLGCLERARTWARAHGGGAVVMLIDDARQPHEPVDRQNIRRVRGLLDADRWELPVLRWDHRGRPEIYQLNLNRPGGGQQSFRVHADRVVRVRGIPLPRRRSLARQGWDGSVYDLVMAPLRAYGTTQVQAAEAVTLMNTGILTSPYLSAAVETDQGAAVFQARLRALRKAMGMYHEVALGEGESYAVHNRSLAGLGDAVKAATDALVAAADGIPKLLLLREPTSGFSNQSEGELRAWYDLVAARQPKYYSPAVRRVVEVVQLSHEGPTGGRLLPFEVEWRALYELSELEVADRDLKRSQRRQLDISSTVVSPQRAAREPCLIELYGEPEPVAPLDPATGPIDQDVPLGDAPDDGEGEAVIPLLTPPPSHRPMPADLVDEQTAAGMAAVSVRKIRRMIRAGTLEYWDFDGTWRVSAADLAQLGQRHRAQV